MTQIYTKKTYEHVCKVLGKYIDCFLIYGLRFMLTQPEPKYPEATLTPTLTLTCAVHIRASFYVQFWRYLKNYFYSFLFIYLFLTHAYQKACEYVCKVLRKYFDRFLIYWLRVKLTRAKGYINDPGVIWLKNVYSKVRKSQLVI